MTFANKVPPMKYVVLAGFLLSGCAATGANVTGNTAGVTVNNVWNRNQAFPLADAHCKKYGKVAKPSQADGDYAFSFECVSAE